MSKLAMSVTGFFGYDSAVEVGLVIRPQGGETVDDGSVPGIGRMRWCGGVTA